MEEADSLLSLLTLKDGEQESSNTEKTAFLGQKKPKNDQTVIEELHTLNTQLRTLITQLLTQLDASEKQVEALRARLRAYEEDFPCPLPDLTPLEMPQYEYSSGPDDIFPELDKSGS